jgi:hypothetical protein
MVKLGNKEGTYTVRAVSRGLSGTIDFTATAVTAAASSISRVSGNSLSGLISKALAQPFVVKVKDAQGNPVQGYAVSFSIYSAPSGTTGQKLSVTSAVRV